MILPPPECWLQRITMTMIIATTMAADTDTYSYSKAYPDSYAYTDTDSNIDTDTCSSPIAPSTNSLLHSSPLKHRLFQDTTNHSSHCLSSPDHSPFKKHKHQHIASGRLPPRRPLPSTLLGDSFARSLGIRGHKFSSIRNAAATSSLLSYTSRPIDLDFVSGPDHAVSIPFAIAFTTSHPIFAVANELGSVAFLDAACTHGIGLESSIKTIDCHRNAVFDMDFSSDDYYLATASGDQCSRVFDVVTEEMVFQLTGHAGSVKEVAFNNLDSNILATCARDGNIHLYDLRCTPVTNIYQKPTNTIVHAHDIPNSSITSISWLSNSTTCLYSSCSSNSMVKEWDTRMIPSCAGLRRRKTIPVMESGPSNQTREYGTTSLNVSRDSSRIYALSKDSSVHVYSPRNLSNGPIERLCHPNLEISTFFAKSAVSQDGKSVAVGNGTGAPVVFDVDTGVGVALSRGHSEAVTGISFGIGGMIASISDDSTVRVWKPEGEDILDGRKEKEWGWGYGVLKLN
ncbi:Cell division cycle protein cdt2 [Neolecta irregularis DAH-3]|uniref:Cell division cycle protein cdt2 n=1 Tax=Neolecta irregularis (strain DAH-3) TaxID=1198029 RepID=A0A1U7LR52_NEOID|nr:Cell division cycle protein cdt2 [Neolecta irregularis DAH-3]|eukprot:OLL25137.1 Cell division cycle protein cdt2 [Neolecta irregularis DAH-3]